MASISYKYYPVVCNLNYCTVFTSCAISHVHDIYLVIVRCVVL